MNFTLEQKEKFSELGNYTYKEFGFSEKVREKMIENTNPIKHIDDILRGLSEDQKFNLDSKLFDKSIPLSQDVVKDYLWFRENPEKVLELVWEVVK